MERLNPKIIIQSRKTRRRTVSMGRVCPLSFLLTALQFIPPALLLLSLLPARSALSRLAFIFWNRYCQLANWQLHIPSRESHVPERHEGLVIVVILPMIAGMLRADYVL